MKRFGSKSPLAKIRFSKKRLSWIRGLALALLFGASIFLGNLCLVSDLKNDFDLKSPQGYLFFLGGQPGCRFDEGTFNACTFGP